VVLAEQRGRGVYRIVWPYCGGVVPIDEPEPDDLLLPLSLPLPQSLSLRAATDPFQSPDRRRVRVVGRDDLVDRLSIDIFDSRGRLVRELAVRREGPPNPVERP
jgi:hypothetical protein